MGKHYSNEENKVPVDEGQLDEGTGLNRINFKFELEKQVALDDALVAALLQGLQVEVKAVTPKMVLKEEEEEVVVSEDGSALVMSTVHLGVAHVPLASMVHVNSRESQHKHPLYLPSILDSYSLYYPDPQEATHLQKHVASLPVSNRVTSPTKKDAAAKKAEPKKVDPKKAKKDDTARQVEPVEMLAYLVHRPFVFCREEKKTITPSEVLLAVSVRLS